MDRARQAERGRPATPPRASPRQTPTSCCSRRTRWGTANLCRLITDAHMLGERSDPSVTASQICAHAAGSGRAARAAFGGGTVGRRRPDRRRAPSPPSRSGRRSDAIGASWRSSIGWSVRRTTRCGRCCGSPSGSRSRAVATNPVQLPGARGRVPRRRARVHAEDRADRAEPRQSAERRRLVEVGGCDAGAVRRAAGALRRHARDRGDVRVRPGVEADAFPGLPGAGRAERRIGARGSVPPGDRGSERGRRRRRCGLDSSTSSR